MSLFDDASLVLTPNGYKASKLYSIKPTSGLGDMTVVRATTATRVNSAGLIESVAIDVPRIDYPPLGGCPSILVEPLRTNLVLRSEQFDNASWTKVDSTVTANTTTAPNGTVTADKLVANAVSAVHVILQTPAGSVSGTTVTASVFAKADGLSRIQLVNNAGGGANGNFNLTTGTATLGSSGVSVAIEDYGNGWFRCSMTYIPTNTGNFNIQIRLADNSGNTTFLGNGVDGVSIWGFQLEVGTNATSYIPTTTATVTRNADVISKTGVSSLIGQTEGVFYAEMKLSANDNTNKAISINDGSGSTLNRIFLRYTNVINQIRILLQKNGVIQYDNTQNILNSLNFIKIALNYKNNDFKLFINGILVNSSLTGTTFSGSTLNKIDFNDGVINPFFGEINSIQLYTTALTDAQCISLTTL